MYYHKVEICGVNTAKLPVLKEKEKMELIVKAQAGDKEARQKMINGNLRLVLSVVQKFTGRGENLDDLFQVGCIGLIKAIDNFNPGLGLRFSTYGQPMIHRRDTPFSAGQQRHARQPFGAGCGVQGHAGTGAAAKEAGAGA